MTARTLTTLALAGLALVPLAGWAQIQRTEQQDTPVAQAKRWALVVGAKDYEFYSPLDYAVNDATKFAQTLIDTYRFDKDSVALLTEEQGPRKTPTVGHIKGELATMLADKRFSKSDLFVFFFAGHGVGKDSKDYLLPTDARPESATDVGLPVSYIFDKIKDAGLKNVLIIADACRSGGENKFGSELQELGQKYNLAVLLGCQPGRRSYEYGALKHGAFAYHLLKALAKPELRDASSGALWASKVSEYVQKSVYDYTERDYGDAAQRPATWNDPTRDILLGAFLPKDFSKEGLQKLQEQAKSLDKATRANALIEYGQALFDEDRFAECVEVLKTVESLDALTASAMYTLGVALKLMDRTGESAKVLEKLSGMESEGYYSQLAVLSNPQRGLSDEKKLAAAAELWSIDKSWSTGLLVWNTYRQMAPQDKYIEFLKEFAALEGLTDRQKHFAEGDLAVFTSRYSDAVEHFQAALKAKGDSPSSLIIRLMLVPPLEILGKTKELEALTESALKDADPAYWLILKARLAKQAGDKDAMEAALDKVLDSRPDSDQLLQLMHLAGVRAFVLKDKIHREASRMPYSWKAQLVDAIASIVEIFQKHGDQDGQKALEEAVNKAGQYADDEIRFMTEAFAMMDNLVVELASQKGIPVEKVAQIQNLYFSIMLGFVGQFGSYDDAWYQLLYFALSTERSVQLDRIFSNHVGPQLKPGAVNGSLRMYMLQTALCVGNEPLIEKLLSQGGLLPTDRVDATWLYSAYLASVERFAEAEKLIQSAPSPTAGFQPLSIALRAWFDARGGRKDAAKAKLAGLQPDGLHMSALMGLAYAALGDWQKAEPLLTPSRSARNWSMTFIHAAACKALFARALAQKDVETADSLAYEAGLSQAGNRLFNGFHFGLEPDLGAYRGTVAFSVTMGDDRLESEQGSLTLTFEPSGKVAGTYESAEGKVRTISGAIDAYGNLTGKVRGEGKEMEIVAKLAPPDRYTKMTQLKQPGQLILLYDNEYRTVWIATPK